MYAHTLRYTQRIFLLKPHILNWSKFKEPVELMQLHIRLHDASVLKKFLKSAPAPQTCWCQQISNSTHLLNTLKVLSMFAQHFESVEHVCSTLWKCRACLLNTLKVSSISPEKCLQVSMKCLRSVYEVSTSVYSCSAQHFLYILDTSNLCSTLLTFAQHF